MTEPQGASEEFEQPEEAVDDLREELEPVSDETDAGELAPEIRNEQVEAPDLDDFEEPLLLEYLVQEDLPPYEEEQLLRTVARLAPNVAAVKRVVLANRGLFRFLGDIGDAYHQAGGGDHTYRSTHRGKYGYPTQGVVHAIDIGGTDALLRSIEYWIRNEIRANRLSGLKYINVLNRHWNFQTWSNYYAARAGRLRPTYSGDHHLHLSFENGSIDGNLLSRYLQYRTGGGGVTTGDFPAPATFWSYRIGSPSLYTGTKYAGDLLKAGYQANVRVDALEDTVARIEAAVARIEAALGQ